MYSQLQDSQQTTPRAPDRARAGLRRLWASTAPEWIASFLAILGVAISVLINFHVRLWQASGSDFKTLYASAWNLARGSGAYDFGSLERVFLAQGVVGPMSWYAHAPVYPPFTLALLTPVTALPMVPAVYVWVGFSIVVMASAIAMLALASGEAFGLTRPWRLALIALAAAMPLFSFGLEMANVSPVVAALCVMAVLGVRPGQQTRSLWPTAFALGLALLLKPHIALWVALALLLAGERGRTLAKRALAGAIAAGMVILVALHLLTARGTQLWGYRGMLQSELAAGSMSPGNRELIAVAGQITWLRSLLGYFGRSSGVDLLTWGILAGLAGTLLWSTVRLPRDEFAPRLLVVAAWCSLGMIVSYHRAHDGLVLILLLPVILVRLRARWTDGLAWMLTSLLALESVQPPDDFYRGLGTHSSLLYVAEFFYYRQAPLAAALLACVLVAACAQTAMRETQTVPHPSRSLR